MEDAESAKGMLSSLPELLNQYSAASFTVLGVLLAGALVLFAVHFRSRGKRRAGLPRKWVAFAGLLAFLSLGGGIVKWSGARAARAKQARAVAEAQKRRAEYIARNRARDDETRLMVADFRLPSSVDEAKRRSLSERMQHQAEIISGILSEELPTDFEKPQVVPLPMTDSPWPEGIREDNVDLVLEELHGFELIWGSVVEDGSSARLFVGVPRKLAPGLDSITPLKMVRFADDPDADYFREGRQYLLGQVMLGTALETFQRATAASGSARKDLFLRAASQFQRTRRALSNWRSDGTLARTVFSPKVDELIKQSVDQAGLSL